jgi:hypothetical protein
MNRSFQANLGIPFGREERLYDVSVEAVLAEQEEEQE